MKTEKPEPRADHGIRLQVIGSIFACSLLVASVTAKRLSWDAAPVFVATAVILSSLWAMYVKINARSAAARARQFEKRGSEIARINIEDAKTMAYTLLADAERFRSVNASEPYRDPLNVMPRQLSEFFSRYARVAAVFGDAVLDRDLVARSASNDRFIRIGTDVADCELAILPKQEAIYEVDDGPASEFRIYPSVYHLIISLDQDYN